MPGSQVGQARLPAHSRQVGSLGLPQAQNPTLQSDSPSRTVWFGLDLGDGGVSAMLTPDHPGLNWLPQDLRNPGAALINHPVGEALRGDAHQCSGSRVRAPERS